MGTKRNNSKKAQPAGDRYFLGEIHVTSPEITGRAMPAIVKSALVLAPTDSKALSLFDTWAEQYMKKHYNKIDHHEVKYRTVITEPIQLADVIKDFK